LLHHLIDELLNRSGRVANKRTSQDPISAELCCIGVFGGSPSSRFCQLRLYGESPPRARGIDQPNPTGLCRPAANMGPAEACSRQACSLCVRPMGGVSVTEKCGRGGPPRNHGPHRHGPEGTAYPPPGPSSHRQPCVAGLKSRSAHGDPDSGQSQNGRPTPRAGGASAIRPGQGGRG
jgi:hypothetical protein